MSSSQQLIEPLNLIPVHNIREYKRNKARMLASLLLAFLTVMLVVVQIYYQQNICRLKQELEVMQLAIGESRDLQNQTHELKAKLEHEKQRDYLLRNQISIDPASRMCSIEAIVPVNTEISRINLSRNKLSLTGQATKPQDIALFLQQLQRLYGNNIRLTTCQLKADSRYYFQMEGEGIRY